MTTDATPRSAEHGEHFRHAYTRDRTELLHRLRRIEGQARGLQRLVEGEAYCLDVLQQVEALTAAAAAALTVYDMLKAAERGMEITGLRLLAKSGGRSGEWHRAKEPAGGGAPPEKRSRRPGERVAGRIQHKG